MTALLALVVALAALAGAAAKSTNGGDPIMSSFDGRKFEFKGAAGSIYNVLSERDHQVSMKLKEGKMWDHVGTYMSALGFKYQDHTVIVSEQGDELEVVFDGEPMALRRGQTEVEHVVASGALSVSHELHRADYGNAVEINTDLLKLFIWIVPAGTRDEGGVVQPAYLNFEVTMLADPAGNAMEGLVGETYGKEAPQGAEAGEITPFQGVDADYELAAFFDAAHPRSLFGKVAGASGARRLLARGRALNLPVSGGYRA